MRCLPILALCAGLAGAALAPVHAQPANPPDDPARWEASFAAFAEADQARPPRTGGVVFVGSSSIRLWDGLERDFGEQAVVVKRGFGGSRLRDCTRHVARLVLPYRPRLVVIYAGDNDLAEGRTPEQVAADFTAFVGAVHETLPATRIAYLSIKPSPLRAALLPQVQRANALVADIARSNPSLEYIDVHSPMLGPNGAPRDELFAADRLHLSRQGYRLWQSVIAAHLR